MNTIPKIIEAYKQDKSFQEMTDKINEVPEITITRPQINNWALGIAKPNKYWLYYLAHRGTEWPSHMAFDMLKLIYPEML